MKITSSAISVNVDDVTTSSTFLQKHFGFREEMAADGFASLARDDAGMNVLLHRRGLEVLPEDFRDLKTSGVIIAFVVTDLAAERARLVAEGVEIGLEKQEPWGEHLFQVIDPNGIIIQLVEWSTPTE